MRTDLALAALASAAVPGMKPVAVAAVAPGDDDLAAGLQSALVEDATGRRWVVRCPLSPVAGARLQRNDELVRHLARHLPFKVPAAAGQAPVGKDGAAVVYPHVEGSPLELRRLPAGPGLASAVGRAVAAVHNIPRAVFEEQDVPVFEASGARQRAVAEVDRAAETGRVPSGLLARWEEAFEAAPLWQFATTPVHGAFTGSRVVVAFTDEDDASTGRVVAVTDWDEAMVGDPAVDLAALYVQTSRQAWDAVLDSYTLARAHRPDPYLHARARLVAELRHLRGLARSVAEGDEETARRVVEVLRRVDRLTEADDSLVPVTARASGTAAQPAGATAAPGDGAAEDGDDAHALQGHDDAPAAAEVPHDGDDATTEVSPPEQLADEAYEAGAEEEGAEEEGEHGRRTAEHGDADLTVQIPVAGAAGAGRDGDDEDGGAVVDEAAGTPSAQDDDVADGALHDLAAPDGTRPQDDAEPGPTADDTDDTDDDAPSDELRDDERLQELYGMPAPDRTDGR